jgi:hypothetical protein
MKWLFDFRHSIVEDCRVVTFVLLRILTFSIVVTSCSGTHISFSIRLLWFETGALFCLWDNALDVA